MVWITPVTEGRDVTTLTLQTPISRTCVPEALIYYVCIMSIECRLTQANIYVLLTYSWPNQQMKLSKTYLLMHNVAHSLLSNNLFKTMLIIIFSNEFGIVKLNCWTASWFKKENSSLVRFPMQMFSYIIFKPSACRCLFNLYRVDFDVATILPSELAVYFQLKDWLQCGKSLCLEKETLVKSMKAFIGAHVSKWLIEDFWMCTCKSLIKDIEIMHEAYLSPGKIFSTN